MVRCILAIISSYAVGCASVGIKRRMADPDPDAMEDVPKAVPKQPSGGIKQQLADPTDGHTTTGSSSSSSIPAPPLPMTFEHDMKKDWSKGKLSSQQVQHYAKSSMGQGAQGLEAMSSAGSSGRHPGNVFRSLKTLWGMPEGAPAMKWLEIATAQGPSTPHPFFLPHEFFPALMSKLPNLFAEMVTGVPGHAWNIGHRCKIPHS